MAGALEQQEGQAQRQPVRGHDPRRATQREAPERRLRALAVGGGDPRPREQEARQDEEQPDRHAELADDGVHEDVVVRAVGLGVHPDVQADHRERGEAAQTVEACHAGTGGGGRSWHERTRYPQARPATRLGPGVRRAREVPLENFARARPRSGA